MASTFSEAIKRSAAEAAAAASTQVESARAEVTFEPPSNKPLLETSSIANSAPAAIDAARDSAGPVNPKAIPRRTLPE